MKKTIFTCCLIQLLLPTAAYCDDGRQVEVTLTLHNNGQVRGRVLEYDDNGLVLNVKTEAITLTWDEIKTTSAYKAKKKILASVRGSEKNLTAEDHFQLGVFLAMRNQHSSAVSEFRKAEQRDPGMKSRIQQAWKEIRRAKERNKTKITEPIVDKSNKGEGDGIFSDNKSGQGQKTLYKKYTQEQHTNALNLYREFGDKVRDKIAPNLVLLETRNYLIWTDWPESKRNKIPEWAEQIYREMCTKFGVTGSDPIWLGKCPIYCFRDKTGFNKFAREVDGYERSAKSLGYTKTANNGYAHVVMKKLGDKEVHINQFASTMVHELTHAFMHNYISPQNLPPWLNEGIAEYFSELVLGDKCQAGERAIATAKYYVDRNKPIDDIFEFTESPPGQYYPIAHSLVEFMISKDSKAFVGVVSDIKASMKPEDSLARRYKGMSYKTLQRDWRSWVKDTYLKK